MPQAPGLRFRLTTQCRPLDRLRSAGAFEFARHLPLLVLSKLKEFDMRSRMILPVWIGLWVVVFVGLLSFASIAQRSDTPQWQEVLTFKQASLEPPTWCGETALAVKASDWETERGGIVHIDVLRKKQIWVTRNPLTKDPFYSHDGSLVFYYRMRTDPGIQEGHVPDGMWEHRMETRKTRAIGFLDTDNFRHPASPTEKVYALVAKEKGPAFWPDLPGWRILPLPKDDHVVDSAHVSQWASDGSYLVLDVKGECTKKIETLHVVGQGTVTNVSYDCKKTAFSFYDAAGHLIRNVPKAALHLPTYPYPKALRESLYAFGRDGRLRRLSPWTGQTEELPVEMRVEKGLFTFDVSGTGGVVYSRDDSPAGVWITSTLGVTPERISVAGAHPRFSRNGEYVAFIRRDRGANGVLVILKREIKK